MTDHALGAAVRLHEKTGGLVGHTPSHDPARGHVQSMRTLTTELLRSGWDDDDIVNFQSLLLAALTETNNPVVVDALLHTYTSLFIWSDEENFS